MLLSKWLSRRGKSRIPTRWLGLESLEDRSVPAAFTPGNLVILRVGEPSTGLAGVAAPVFLDEYSTGGSLVQSVTVPASGVGSGQHILTIQGTSTSEGLLSLSGDGQYLLFGGYEAAVGTASPSSTSTSGGTPVLRVFGRASMAGTIDTSTTTTSFSGGNIRSVTSTNGTDLWATGSNTGIVYNTLGGSGAGTIVSTTQVNMRNLAVVDGQLYASSGSGTNTTRGVNTVGSGAPTTTGQTTTRLPGLTDTTNPSTYGFFFADLSASVSGNDTLYVADDGAGALTKFSLVSDSWVSNGTITGIASRGITGVVSGTNVDLYALRSSSGTPLVTITDTSGYNGAFAGSVTQLVAAATNTAFRGIVRIPASPPPAPPKVTKVDSPAADATYGIGAVIPITVTFDQAVDVTGTPQLILENGAGGQPVDFSAISADHKVLTFDYTVATGDLNADLEYVGTGSLTLNGGTIKNGSVDANRTLPLPYNANSLGNLKNIVVDGVIPFIADVSSSSSIGTYAIGQSIDVVVSFSEPVTVTGSPSLLLETGATDHSATYLSGSGTPVLVFRYTVQPGDVSSQLDYVDPDAMSVAGGSIKDGGNDADLTLPDAGTSNFYTLHYVVDGVAPAAVSVASPTADATYGPGSAIDIEVTFNDAVTVSGGPPLLKLETGTVDRSATYVGGSGTNTLTFRYIVQSGDSAGDLDYFNAAALTVNGGTIRDSAGNDAVLTLPAPGAAGSLAAGKAIVVDGRVPTVTAVSPSLANGVYGPGTTFDIRVSFSETVVVTGGTPQLKLETGAIDHSATYLSGSGSFQLVFRYTVQSGDATPDLEYFDISSLTLEGATIKDAAGNDAALTLPAPGGTGSMSAFRSIELDGIAPTITNVTSSIANRTYIFTEVVSFQVTFSEPVFLINGASMLMETGAVDRFASYVSGHGTNVLTFQFQVAPGNESADLDYVSAATLTTGGSVRDVAGNNAVLTLPAPGGPNSLSANKDIVIDGVIPFVTNVTSPDADGVYGPGSAITVQIQYDDAVVVTGAPTLAMLAGPASREAVYTGGSGTNTITFQYTIQSNDRSTDLDYVNAGSLNFNGGTIKDVSGNDVVVWLPERGFPGSLSANKNIVVDGVGPAVLEVDSPMSGRFMAGEIIDITVKFDEVVNVTGAGAPLLHLETGTVDRDATYLSGGGTNTLTFRYTVQPGDNSSDLSYIDSNSLVLNGGIIRDGVGNAAALTLPAPGTFDSLSFNTFLIVDTIAPVVQSIASNDANGIYAPPGTLVFTIVFSESVSTSGAPPKLRLETGATDRDATTAITGGTSFQFLYTIQPGDFNSDLDYVDANALTGTFTDSAGNVAVLTLPAPGTAGSISASKNIAVDGILPAVNSFTQASSTPTNADSISYSLAFTEPVTGVDPSDFDIIASGATHGALSVSGGGANWTVTVNGVAGDGTLRVDLKNNGTIRDVVFAPLTGGTVAGAAYTIDNTAPTVVVSQAAGQADPAAGQPIAFTVVFSEPIQMNTFSGMNITLSGTAIHNVEGITTNNPSGDRRTFDVTVHDLIADGTVIVSVAAGEVQDDAGNFNLADSSIDKEVLYDVSDPSVSYISPSGNPSVNGTTAVFFVLFSEAVSGVTTGNFSLFETGVSGSTVDSVAPDSNPSAWLVTITVGAGDGTVRLDLTDTTAVRDAADRPLSGTHTGDDLLFVDRTAPTAAFDVVVTPRPTPLSSIDLFFDEYVSTPNISDFTLTLDGSPVSLFGASVTDYFIGQLFTLEGLDTSLDGEYVLTFNAGSSAVADDAGNLVGIDAFVSFTVDSTPPTVTLVEPVQGPTNAGSLDFTVSFSEPVLGLVEGNFSVATTGSLPGAAVSALTPTIDPLVWTVSVNPGTGVGTVQLVFSDSPSITDAAGNPIAGAPTSSGLVAIDTVPASITIDDGDADNLVAGGAVLNYTIDVTDANPGAFSLLAGDLSNAGAAGVSIGTIASSPIPGGLRFSVPVTATTGGTVLLRINASANLTDAAGNTALLPAQDNDIITVDATAPTVTVNPAAGQASSTNTQPVQFAVVFSEPVSGFTLSSIVTSGTAGNAAGATKVVTNPSSDNRNFVVTVSGLTGDGTLTLTVPAGAATDAAGNPNATSTGSNTIALDFVPPNVNGIVRSNPLSATTNLAQVVYQVNFSDPVIGVDQTDFFLTTSGVFGATVAGVGGSGTTWFVTVNTGAGEGTIKLNVTDNDSIRDAAANKLGGTGANNGNFTAGESYTVDRSLPAVLNMTRLDPVVTNLGTVRWRVTFSEPIQVSSLDAADLTLIGSGTTFGTLTVAQANSGATDSQFIVTVDNVAGTGTLRLDVVAASASILDASGNALAIGFNGPAYTIDHSAPTVVVAQAAAQSDPVQGQPIRYTISFSEPVSGFGPDQVALSGTAGGLADATVVVTNPTGNLRDYELTVSALTGDGTVIVNIPAGAVTDTAGNPGAASTGVDITVTYDTTPPFTSLPDLVAGSDSGTSSTDNLTSDTTPTFTGTAEAGAFIQLLGGSTVIGTAIATGGAWSITVPAPLPNGVYNVKARATDAAGNSFESTFFPVTIDTIGPAASVTRAPGQAASDSATNAAFTVRFAVEFDQDIPALNASDLFVSGTTGGSVVSIAGSGASYIVAVGNLAQPGIVGLNVLAAFGSDNAGNAGTASPPSPTVSVAFTTQTQVQVTPGPLTAGEDATVTATVNAPAGGVPSGSVVFTLTGPGGTVNRTINLSSGSAATTFTALAAGNYSATATYQPAAGYIASNSGTTFSVTPTDGGGGGTPVDANAVGEYAGVAGRTVTQYNADGTVKRTLLPFTAAEASGGVRAVVADITGDGTPDVAAVTGPGSPARLRVFDGASGNLIYSRTLFEGFTGGAFVAAGDLDGDGAADLAVTPDRGGGPRVTLFNGPDGTVIGNFFGIDDADFRGGARTAIGDLNNDGINDLLVSAGFSGGPRVAGYDGVTLLTSHGKLFNDFFLFETTLRNGAYVSLGDLNDDGFADIIGGGGPGGAPRVLAIDGKAMVQGNAFAPLVNFFAGSTDFRGGVRVAAKDFDGDGLADLATGSGDTGDLLVFFGDDLLAGDTDAARETVLPGAIDGVYVG